MRKLTIWRREWNHEKTPRVEMNYPRVDAYVVLSKVGSMNEFNGKSINLYTKERNELYSH